MAFHMFRYDNKVRKCVLHYLVNFSHLMSYIQCSVCRDGKYRRIVNLLRKYFGDLLIASYLVLVQDSGFDVAYVEEIEVSIPYILTCV